MRKIAKFCILIPFLLVCSLNAADWYVRPEGGSYGAENGTSYANAWDGLKKVVWGNNGVKAGDTLYICGLHLKEYKAGLTTVDRTITPVGGSGDSSRVTIRGDYPGDPGIIWGGSLLKHEPWVNEGSNTYSITLPMDMWTDWFFEDVTASGRTVLTKVGSLAECQSRPGSHYSSNYQQGSKLYIHCSNNGDPTNRIVANGGGWFWACDTASYLTFKNLKFYCRNIVSAFSHMRYDGCTIWYADVNVLTFTEQYSYVEIISCDIAHGQTGIGFAMQLAGTGPHHVLVRGNKIHDMGTRPSLYNPDSHAIGVNSLSDSIIELNEMYNCGSTLAFYAYDSGINSSIKNNTVRWNYIHDAHRLGGSSGNGIEFTCGASHGDCSGNACIGNIVVCTGEDAFRSKWKQTVKFYNNVAYGASRFNYYFGNAYNEVRVEAKNNISMNPGTYHIEFQTNAAAGNYVCDVDYNLYYPDSGTKFIFQDASDVQYVNFSGWKSLAKPGCTFDPHSPTPADPKFVNASGTLRLDTDFKLQSSSPAIDRGVNVGLTQDRAGVAVPKGYAPDIGAFENIKTIYSKIEASPISGQAPLTVNFLGKASGDYPPFIYSWNFGDGMTSALQNPSHTYSATGDYMATLTVSDYKNNRDSDSILIYVHKMHSLYLSIKTGAPALGVGGTTNPLPGTHTYIGGSSIQLSAISNINYRFSLWSGDINDSEKYKKDAVIIIDKDKSIAANFCSKCGDVNGDLSVTPTDAQRAFDIFLGKIPNPTVCEKENGDVNCDGSKTEPKVTPGDAQIIFDKYLGKSDLPSNCSGSTRVSALSMRKLSSPKTNLIINDAVFSPNKEIIIPVIADSVIEISAFGFDLSYPNESLEFIGLEKTDYSDNFLALEANKVNNGVIRVGGYKNKSSISRRTHLLITLIALVFKGKAPGKSKETSRISFINTYDDLQNATIRNGIIRRKFENNRKEDIKSPEKKDKRKK